MSDRKSLLEMLSEFFREVAVLTAVFIPLDRLMMDEPLTIGLWIAILGRSGGSLGLLVVEGTPRGPRTPYD